MKEDGFGKRKEIAQWQFFCYFMIVYHKVFCCLFIWHTNIRKQNNEKKWNFYEDLAHFLELLAHFSDPSEGFMIHAKKKVEYFILELHLKIPSKSLISRHFERNTNKNQSVDHLADLVFRESKSLVHPYSIIQPLRTRAPSRSCSFKVVLPRVIISTVKILPTHTPRSLYYRVQALPDNKKGRLFPFVPLTHGNFLLYSIIDIFLTQDFQGLSLM